MKRGASVCWCRDEISHPEPWASTRRGAKWSEILQRFGMGFSWRIGSIFISRYFNPLFRVAIHPSSCTRTLNHHLHLSFTCTGDKCFKLVIKRNGWRGIIAQVYTPGDDLSVIPLRTSSIWSSSTTTVERGQRCLVRAFKQYAWMQEKRHLSICVSRKMCYLELSLTMYTISTNFNGKQCYKN